VTADEARELRHELRTPVNHLIGYSELLLEEDDVSPEHATTLESIRSVARQVLDLVPGLLADDAPLSAANSEAVSALTSLVEALRTSTSALITVPGSLPADDLSRLATAADRLGDLAGRLTSGPVLVDRSTGTAAAPTAGRLETCLVVDDDAANRDVLGRRLAKLGYGVIEARDGVEALERLADSAATIDLVLLDVMMPRLDGFAVLERHRNDPQIRHIPVIMISALDDMSSIVRCIEAGAVDYLPKPFDPVLLKARVGACMEAKRLRDAERNWNQQLEARVAEQVRKVEQLNLMQRFVPPQLMEVIAAGGVDLLASHRRDITVLFADLRGFTAFAERSEPEDVMGVLREFHDAVGPHIFEQGGTLSQFTGDGMMVFFNDPIPCDDPARRAVALALSMRETTSVLSAQWKSRGHNLTLGLGVAAGYATCGQIGFEGRFEYTAIGSVVNLSARLCGEAKGGQVLVSDRVASMLGDALRADHIGSVELKGLARPTPIFEVHDLSA
jgi:adenylate cyclase